MNNKINKILDIRKREKGKVVQIDEYVGAGKGFLFVGLWSINIDAISLIYTLEEAKEGFGNTGVLIIIGIGLAILGLFILKGNVLAGIIMLSIGVGMIWINYHNRVQISDRNMIPWYRVVITLNNGREYHVRTRKKNYEDYLVQLIYDRKSIPDDSVITYIDQRGAELNIVKDRATVGKVGKGGFGSVTVNNDLSKKEGLDNVNNSYCEYIKIYKDSQDPYETLMAFFMIRVDDDIEDSQKADIRRLIEALRLKDKNNISDTLKNMSDINQIIKQGVPEDVIRIVICAMKNVLLTKGV